MQLNSFELSVAIPRDGRSTKIREYGRNGLTFVEGRRGQPFSLTFRNNSAHRVLAIFSIDGLDVLSGQAASPASRGYVVNGYSNCEISGWRTSLSEIHQFVFEDKPRSYAAGSVGDTRNCGVIAVKVFGEKEKPIPQVIHYHHHHQSPVPVVPVHPYPWFQPVWTSYGTSGQTVGGLIHPRDTNTERCIGTDNVGDNSAPTAGINMMMAASEAPNFALGTGWGSAKGSVVSTVDFDRGTELLTLTLYYSDAESLRAMGIELDKEIAIAQTLPQAFGGFCTPPGVR